MDELWTALIGCGGAVLGVLISGLIEIYITRKTLQNAKSEFNATITQMREQEHKEAMEKAKKFFHNENQRFYDNLFQEMLLYDRLRNELHYLNNVTHPNRKELRVSLQVYAHIDNEISKIIGNVQLPGNIAALLGALRCNISYYNAALDKGEPSEIMEELIGNIFKTIGPINDEMFSNYANVQAMIRQQEIELGKKELE